MVRCWEPRDAPLLKDAIDSSLDCAGYFPPRGRGRGPALVPGDRGVGTRQPIRARSRLLPRH